MQVSQLKFYSIGTVAANKARSSKWIEVTPLEAVNQISGQVTDNINTISLKGQDDVGGSFETKVNIGGSIPAQWLPLGDTNRMTAPDVRRGEQVLIWEFADTNEYWWTTLKDSRDLRKLETVIFAFSATRKESDKSNADTVYFLEISTHDKRIQLHTSKADEEPYGYDFVLDTAKGTFLITDDIRNSIFLDSKERQLVVTNADKSYIEVNKHIITMDAVDHIILKAGKTIRAEAPDSITGVTNHFTMDSPTSDFTGNVNVAKNLFVSGGFGIGKAPGGAGTASISGSLQIDGSMSSRSGGSWDGTLEAAGFRIK